MKQTSFSISIPEPCQEGWEQMTPCEGGRFCGSCQKTVIDFTGYTDAQLAAFFSGKKNEVVCGMYRASQLNRPILVHQPHSLLYQWIMAVGIAAITLTVAPASAQTSRQSPPALVKDSFGFQPSVFSDSNRNGLTTQVLDSPSSGKTNPRGEELVIGGSATGEAIIIIEGRRISDGTPAPPEQPLLQVPTIQTYTGEEWDRTRRSIQDLGAQ